MYHQKLSKGQKIEEEKIKVLFLTPPNFVNKAYFLTMFHSKMPRGPSICAQGNRLSTQGTSQWERFTSLPPRLFHRLPFFLNSELCASE